MKVRIGVAAAAIVVLGCKPDRTGPELPPGTRVGFYVTPTGTSGGDGSTGDPWDLATALDGGGGAVGPGDTIWLRDGTYTGLFQSSLTGSPSFPVIIRQYPGERARINGSLRVDGADVIFWGFEIYQSNPLATNNTPGLETYAPRGKYVNLVIHDAGQQGVTFREGDQSEMYGNIIYNNGTEEALDHGVYATSDAGTRRIADNVFFNNLAYGIHVYGTSSHPILTGVLVEGNASFNNGTISSSGAVKANLLIGADPPTQNVAAVDNMLYMSGTTGQNMRFGLPGRDNRNIIVTGNYAAGAETGILIEDWDQATVQQNTIIGTQDVVALAAPSLAATVWQNNIYQRDTAATAWRYAGNGYSFGGWKTATGLGGGDQGIGGLPGTAKVFVRPNEYEAGRAHVIIYNWGNAATVAVNLTGVLQNADSFEVRNVQNVFGAPVVAGRFSGATVAFPMAGVNPPTATGRPGTPPKTGPAFDVFLVTRP